MTVRRARVPFLVSRGMYILFAVRSDRGGAVWRPRGGQGGANVGAVDLPVFAPEGAPEECGESAGWWCRVSERSRSDGYADSRLAAVVSG